MVAPDYFIILPHVLCVKPVTHKQIYSSVSGDDATVGITPCPAFEVEARYVNTGKSTTTSEKVGVNNKSIFVC